MKKEKEEEEDKETDKRRERKGRRRRKIRIESSLFNPAVGFFSSFPLPPIDSFLVLEMVGALYS